MDSVEKFCIGFLVLLGLLLLSGILIAIFYHPQIELEGELQIGIVRIGEDEYRYEGQEAFEAGTKNLKSGSFKHIISNGIDYFIYSPEEQSSTTVIPMPMPVVVPVR